MQSVEEKNTPIRVYNRGELGETPSAIIEEPGGQSLIRTSCFSALLWVRNKTKINIGDLWQKNIVISDWNSCTKGNLFSLHNLARTLFDKLFSTFFFKDFLKKCLCHQLRSNFDDFWLKSQPVFLAQYFCTSCT